MYYVSDWVKNAERIFPDQGRLGYLRLDMNENPEGLPQDVVDTIKEAITPEFLATYPEPDRLRYKYAAFIGVDPDQVTLTNGSDNAIRYILQTFAKPGHDVLTVTPTFEMYMVNCWLLGLNHKKVPYGEDHRVDIDALIDAMTDETDIVALVNPNNPMGDTYSEADAHRIIEAAASHGAIVLADEAYHYFTKSTLLPLVNEYDNVILTRTFSKCFSLAGVRLGVVISNPTLIHYINNLRVTFEVNTVALKCGEIVLDTPGLIDRLAAIQIEGREFIVQGLQDNGYEVYPSETNFVSFRPKTEAAGLIKRLEEHNILVKGFGGGPLAGWIRINTGSVNVMKRFLDCLLEVDVAEA
ncbi:MAG: histidinol-phosphate aminotransferase family protein [Atopobiaceae bacterium]|nr:histidinol-phosphate aminotransferase family protein [Atopobiaceae bacterium]